jgi:hypothetical protein
MIDHRLCCDGFPRDEVARRGAPALYHLFTHGGSGLTTLPFVRAQRIKTSKGKRP